MLNDFVTVVTNLFRMYIIYRFAGIFLEVECVEKNKQIICYGLFFIVNSGLFVLYHSPVINIVVNLVGGYILYTVLYDGTVSKRILAVGTMYLFNMAADMTIAIPMNLSYLPGDSVSVLSSVLSVLGMFVLEIICECFAKKKMKISVSDTIRFLSVPVCSIVMNGIVMMQQIDNKILIITLGMGTLLINIIVLYYYNQIQMQYEKEYRHELLERQVDEYEEQLVQMEEMYQEMRIMKHEIKHFAGNMEELINLEQKEDFKEVLDGIKDSISRYEMIYFSGNPVLDSILNYICKKAEKQNVYIEADIKIPSDLSLKAIDMNIILGNLLENAIEAVENVSEKFVILHMKYEKEMIFIHIRNSYDGIYYKKGDKYLTKKKNNHNHGIGLENVKRVVEKYNGSIKIEPLESEFIVNILMNNKP